MTSSPMVRPLAAGLTLALAAIPCVAMADSWEATPATRLTVAGGTLTALGAALTVTALTITPWNPLEGEATATVLGQRVTIRGGIELTMDRWVPILYAVAGTALLTGIIILIVDGYNARRNRACLRRSAAAYSLGYRLPAAACRRL